MAKFTESTVEEAALEWLGALGYETVYGPDIAPDSDAPERANYGQVVLTARLDAALRRLNPNVPEEALMEARRQLLDAGPGSAAAQNRAFHRRLVDGVSVEFRGGDGQLQSARVRAVAWETVADNDFLAVNQFTVIENGHERRPDVVVFLNGLPLAVVELKNTADEKATIWSAFHQLQTYKTDIPALFVFNELLVISDGTQARLGSLTADRERFMPWRTIDGEKLAPATLPEQQVLLEGVFERARLLEYLSGFITYEEYGPNIVKILAAYHQFHAVRAAVAETLQASGAGGDRRGGVVWHTQGSGKSLTMLFYGGQIVRRPEMENPTLVVLTDRNDLDDQLLTTWARGQDLLGQTPQQAASRAQLQQLLNVAFGGIVFTTIQKFSVDERGASFPQLSDRRNIVVIADEAHRSQYDFIDGFARHLRDALPNATFLGFTGTPIEDADRSTKNVFGDYISVYDIKQAEEDGATVPLFYEARLAKLALDEAQKPKIDPDFEEVTEEAEASQREKIKRKWAQLEAMIGTPERLAAVAQDLVAHFEARQDALRGKGMIVAMSRAVAVDLYQAIVKIRPQWHSDDDAQGEIKIVMTGAASDEAKMQPHIRPKAGRDAIGARLKDPNDPLQLVIVRDMWLTGFDAPPLHTLYVDKPMQGHSLMQAIARVNRVFGDKPGGLVVDYIGFADKLKLALANYTKSGGRGEAVLDQEAAVRLMLEKLENCRDLMHGFDYGPFFSGTAGQKLAVIPAAQEHVLSQNDGKRRFLDAALALSKAFALAVAHEETFAVRDDVGFFQTVRAALLKTTTNGGQTDEFLNHAVRQIVSKSVVSEGIVDIFSAAGMERPNLSVLSDEFLEDVKNLPYKNLAVEALRKLLAGEIQTQLRGNVVQSKKFSDMLAAAIRAYQNRSLDAAEVIQALIDAARQIRAERDRHAALGLSADEIAFYDALLEAGSVEAVQTDQDLRPLARALVEQVRANATIDWTVKESVRAKLRLLIKRTLRKYGYPPDKQSDAVKIIIKQAEALAAGWA